MKTGVNRTQVKLMEKTKVEGNKHSNMRSKTKSVGSRTKNKIEDKPKLKHTQKKLNLLSFEQNQYKGAHLQSFIHISCAKES